jgi:polyketide cyclase/dehydrase/lipid transport protein
MTWSVEAAVLPEQAYDYVADITRHPEWGMDDMTIQAKSEGPVQVGSKFDAVGTLFGRRNPSELTVAKLERPRLLEFEAHDRRGDTHHTFTFTPVDGGTEIARTMTSSNQPWYGPILAALLRGAINKNYDGALVKLKFMLEAAPKTSA